MTPEEEARVNAVSRLVSETINQAIAECADPALHAALAEAAVCTALAAWAAILAALLQCPVPEIAARIRNRLDHHIVELEAVLTLKCPSKPMLQ